MSDELAKLLRDATGAPATLHLAITVPGETAPLHQEFHYPYVVVGRGEGCDVLLQSPAVSFRHAYLQTIEGRIFCVDLASRTGIHWPDGPRKYGWVPPHAPIRIGPYLLEVITGDAKESPRHDWPSDLDPLERYRGQVGPMPTIDLEFRYEGDQPTWPVNRLRRSSVAAHSARCGSTVPRCRPFTAACSLTRHALWVIDLLGRGGTRVDGRSVRVMPLESGAEILVGSHQIGVFRDEPANMAAVERLTDDAAESETSMDDLESPFLKDSPPLERRLHLPNQRAPRGRSGLAWHDLFARSRRRDLDCDSDG